MAPESVHLVVDVLVELDVDVAPVAIHGTEPHGIAEGEGDLRDAHRPERAGGQRQRDRLVEPSAD